VRREQIKKKEKGKAKQKGRQLKAMAERGTSKINIHQNQPASPRATKGKRTTNQNKCKNGELKHASHDVVKKLITKTAMLTRNPKRIQRNIAEQNLTKTKAKKESSKFLGQLIKSGNIHPTIVRLKKTA